MKYVEIIRDGSSVSYVTTLEKAGVHISQDLSAEESTVGTSFVISIVEMTPEEYEALEEFISW